MSATKFADQVDEVLGYQESFEMPVQVEDHEQIKNNKARMIEDFPIGVATAQGDIYQVSIGTLPKSAKPRANHQVAEGDTQGSRHILADRVTVYDCDQSEVASIIKSKYGVEIQAQYIGPVFASPENPTKNDLRHPEHGNQGFEAGAVIACIHQRNLDAEEREQRARD